MVDDSFSFVTIVFVDEVDDLVDAVLVVDDLLEVFFVVAALAASASALQLEIHSEEVQYAELVPHRPLTEHCRRVSSYFLSDNSFHEDHLHSLLKRKGSEKRDWTWTYQQVVLFPVPGGRR